MLFPADGPADPHCNELLTLHRSMNAPVVAIEGIPVGPAHAAVALNRGADGVVDATVAIRCARTGRVACFTAGSELRDLRSPDIVMDAALSFAESMGFLFDDEEVEIRGADGPREAARIWQQFLNADADGTVAPGELAYPGPDLDLARADASEARGPDPPLEGRGGRYARAGYTGIAQELGPILSPIAPDLDPAVASGSAEREAELLSPDPGAAVGRDAGPPPEAEAVPFWLAIPADDVPRQSARAPAPDASGEDEGSSPPEDARVPDGDEAPKDRELLHRVLAETGPGRRLWGAQPPPGPGLSKFRLKPSLPARQGDPRPDPAPPLEDVAEPEEAAETGVERNETNPAHSARCDEPIRRPHLMLRLLSRF